MFYLTLLPKCQGVRIIGRENYDIDGKYVLVANHQSRFVVSSYEQDMIVLTVWTLQDKRLLPSTTLRWQIFQSIFHPSSLPVLPLLRW